MKTLVIAGTSLRRLFRARANVFFLLVLPMLIILLLGAAFGGGRARLGVAAARARGPLAGALVRELGRQQNLAVERFADAGSLTTAVERGRVQAGVVVPASYDATLRGGGTAHLRYLARPDSLGTDLRATIDAVVASQSRGVRAARLLARLHLASFARGLSLAAASTGLVPAVEVAVVDPGGSAYPQASGRFDRGASSQLLLFVFLNSLTAATALIESRRLGITRRLLSTPTSVRALLAGEGLGRLLVALVQAALIVVGSAVAFSVGWGAPLGAAAVILAFCLVGAGAGLLLGSTLSNEQQAVSASLLLGLGLAALGGSMVPLEVFPATMRTLAHVTPHAWGNDAFSKLLRHHGGLTDVLPDVGVLLGYAAVLLALATWRLRRTLTA